MKSQFFSASSSSNRWLLERKASKEQLNKKKNKIILKHQMNK